MRTTHRAVGLLAGAGRATVVAALLVTGGCATLRNTIGSYDTGPLGIARPQQRLREALVHADFAAAMDWREDDALLRALNTGVAAFHAGDYLRSAAVLDSAALLADDRITASLSRNGLALITNDMARPYQPRRTERLFIAYYGMLAYARLAQWEDAAVEARRLSALLARYGTDRGEDERATHATLHYLAGAVFERAGEPTSAQVAYDNAALLVPRQGDASTVALDAGEGEILVVVERGFIAHRTNESINVFLGDDSDSARHGRGHAHPRTSIAMDERVERPAATGGGRPGVMAKVTGSVQKVAEPRGQERRSDRDADDDEYWLSVAFPALRRSPHVTGAANLELDAWPAATMATSALLDDASSADERRERVAMLTRASARAATKLAVAKAVKDKKGKAAGKLANLGVSLMERADVRSWHVLPQEITLLRLRAPLGVHIVMLRLGAGEGARTVELAPVTVSPGQLSITNVRVWSERSTPLAVARR